MNSTLTFRIVVLSVTVLGFGCAQPKTCGANTTDQAGACVPAETACGTGSTFDSATQTCVPSTRACAAGTTLMAGVCVVDERLCDNGTKLEAATGTCVPAPLCSAGTVRDGGQCVVDAATCRGGTTYDSATQKCLVGGLTCVAGTTFRLGRCLPDGTVVCQGGTTFDTGTGKCVVGAAVCARGTVLTNGACAPDGTIVCQQGQRFEVDGGSCVVDPSACASGTVFVGGRCVTYHAALRGDVTESAEPNDAWLADGGGSAAGAVTLTPDASVVISGCIVQRVPDAGYSTVAALTADTDDWKLTVPGPMLVEITADGVGGLAAAFSVSSATNELFVRQALNLTGDTAHRQVYLPEAGTYHLALSDARGGTGGGTSACYFATLEPMPMPAPTPFTTPLTATYSGNVLVFSRTPTVDNERFTAFGGTDSVLLGGLVSVQGSRVQVGSSSGANYQVSMVALVTSAPQLLIYDPVRLTSPQAWPVSLTGFGHAIATLPVDGGSVDVSRTLGLSPLARELETTVLALDIDQPGVRAIRLSATSGSTTLGGSASVVREGVFGANFLLDVVASIPLAAATPTLIRFNAAGRYYVALRDTTALLSSSATRVTASVVGVPETPLTYGTPLAAQSFDSSGLPRLYVVRLSSPTWVQAAVEFNTQVAAQLDLLDAKTEGALRPLQTTVGSATTIVGRRVTSGEDRDLVLRVTPVSAPVGAVSFSVVVKDEPGFINLGRIVPGSPASASFTLPPSTDGGVMRLFATGVPGADFTLTADGGAGDVSIEQRSVSEAVGSVTNAGAAGVVEALTGEFPTGSSGVVFTVTNRSATSTPTSVTMSSPVPATYAIAVGALPFRDICPDAQAGASLPMPTGVVTGLADDFGFTAPQVMVAPAGFRFFGRPVSAFATSSNGFVTFGDPLVASVIPGQPIPTADGVDFFAMPMGADLVTFVCVVTTSTATTVQWQGSRFGANDVAVQMQARFNANGTIDFIYGLAHDTPSGSIITGLESLAGNRGVPVGYGLERVTPAGRSYTFTPR